MLLDLFPFLVSIRATALAGVGLWSLAFYLVMLPGVDWMIGKLMWWFDFAERSLYQSQQEFEQTRAVRESVNGLYASLATVLPFLLLGAICDYWLEVHLGQAWALTTGLLACGSSVTYVLGWRAGQLS